MTKITEFRDRSVDQLSDELVKLKKEQFNLRFQRASGQLENTARFRVVRRDIARIMTVLGQRQRAEPAKAGAAASARKKTAPTAGEEKSRGTRRQGKTKPAKKPAQRNRRNAICPSACCRVWW